MIATCLCSCIIDDSGLENSAIGSGVEKYLPFGARVAELADAQDLGSCALRRGGSIPPSRTNNQANEEEAGVAQW